MTTWENVEKATRESCMQHMIIDAVALWKYSNELCNPGEQHAHSTFSSGARHPASLTN
jgi:inorganic triphosphatase YgiF